MKGWATIPNIKCPGQNAIDLLAIDPKTGKGYPIETSVSISSGFSKITTKKFDPDLLKQGVHEAGQRRTLGIFADKKFSAPGVMEILENYGLKIDNYDKIIVAWGWTPEAEAQSKEFGIKLWRSPDILGEIAGKIKRIRLFFLHIHAMDPEKVHYNYCDVLTTTPLAPNTKVLVTGANGYVAQRLIPELVHRGYFVRCMLRTKNTPFLLDHPRIEVVYADCLVKEQLRPVLQDIEIAYYLIHSMRAKRSEFAEMDKMMAKNFVEEAEEAGIKKIIYLGGLGETNVLLSRHLQSRMEVGEILSESSIPVIRLHAAIIIGTGSTSYELLKSLVMHSPWIPFMVEFNNLCQCIAIRDVIKYLVGIMEFRSNASRVYHIGGKDVFAYRDVILSFAKIVKRDIRFFDVFWVPLPISVSCRIFACWLHLFTSLPVNIISLLLNSLKSDVVCLNDDIRNILPFEPLSFEIAVRRALERERKSQVFSHWSDVPPDSMRDLLPLYEYESASFVVEEHSIDIPANSNIVFQSITKIGGKHGWLQGNFLWRIRGFIDRLFGGIGLQRGRRDPEQLREGDSLDFWRVEKLVPNKELLLRAELISPGLSWLQFLLDPGTNDSTKLTLKAHFIPDPFWGQLYWFLMSKFHTYIFKGMLAHFRQTATEKNPKVIKS